ncbi:MAG: ClbS/DfsB family four-helix bundle protein [Chloroflexi bacterium]|nr:ClbS/DfsB family four-helix bundle protein [Chloroflexota bacterium]
MIEKPKHLSKTELLESIATEYSRFEDLLSTMTDKQLTQSGAQDDWSVKDILAHIASWENLATNRLEVAFNNETPIYPVIKDWEGVHAFNATCYLENQNKTLAIVLQESQQIHQNFLDTILKLDEHFIAKPLPFDWADGMTVFELIAANSYSHYKEHYDALEYLLNSETLN